MSEPDRPSAEPQAGLGAALAAPSCIARLPARTYLWLGIYVVLAGGLLALVGHELVKHKDDLRQLVMDYLLPESWHFAGGLLIDRFLASQELSVLVNAAVGGSLLLVSLLLFPIKEAVSASYETRANLTGQPIEELPLWLQGWEEVKLVLLYLAAQGLIFWIGYYPGNEILSVVLSYGFLFFSFAIDFLSPVFQRHQGRYSRIIKTLLRHPASSLLFGAMFALPAVIAGHLFTPGEGATADSVRNVVIALFSVNVVSIAWAAVAGTKLASGMMPSFARTSPSSTPVKALAWVALLGALTYNTYTFGSLGRALHHKSQILKCEYDVAWTSFGLDMPSLGGLLSDEVEVGVHFEVEIKNPTEFDVVVEDNHLDITHEGTPVAVTKLSPMTIPSGHTVTQRIEFDLAVSPSTLAKGRELLQRESWKITLFVQVADRFEFPIFLLE